MSKTKKECYFEINKKGKTWKKKCRCYFIDNNNNDTDNNNSSSTKE